MVSTAMNARVRTQLDEASASFWTDAEIYSALSDGQNEVINMLIGLYRSGIVFPEDLKPLLTNYENSSLATFSDTLQADFLAMVSVRYAYNSTSSSSRVTCLETDYVDFYQNKKNTYLTPSATEPQYYILDNSGATQIRFDPSPSGTASYDMLYLAQPSDIASGTNALLPESTHNAIVTYATAQMLFKDQRPQEYAIKMQEFRSQIAMLIRENRR